MCEGSLTVEANLISLKVDKRRAAMADFSVYGEAGRQNEVSAELLISVPEFCRRCGIGRTTAWRLAGSGAITVVHIGRRALVTAGSVEALVARISAGERV